MKMGRRRRSEVRGGNGRSSALKRDRADPQNRDRDCCTAGLMVSILVDASEPIRWDGGDAALADRV